MKSYFKQANSSFIKKEYSKAIGLYKNASNQLKRFSHIYTNLAMSYANVGDYLSARIAYIQAKIYCKDEEAGFALPFWWDSKTKIISKNTVMVFIPVFNASDTLEECINSVISQNHNDVVIIAVNDASSDESDILLRNLSHKYSNLLYIDNLNNSGPFNSVNIALMASASEDFGFYIKHDSDDVMLPAKLELQIQELKNQPFAKFCTTGYSRVRKDNGQSVQGKKRGHNMTLYKKEVFDEIGYFDNTRFGGDSEYLDRALQRFGENAEINLPKKLTKAYYLGEGGRNITTSNPLGSQIRVDYRNYFENIHIKNNIINNWRYDFDRTIFSSLKKIIENNKKDNLIVCGMATIKLRRNSVVDSIKSLLPQVDLLIIYQNGYKDNFGIFDNEKILTISSLDTGIDIGDAGKFFKIQEFQNCYYFSCDDDLIYPENYVSSMLTYLKKFDNKVILTAHGNIMEDFPKHYYQDRKIGFHYRKLVSEGDFCHFGGTGVMAFHTSQVKFGFNMFRAPNMADIWVGLYARENNIPIALCPHPAEWISHSDKFDVNTTIYYSSNSSLSLQDKLIAGLEFKNLLVSENGNILSIEADKLIGKRRRKRREKISIGIPTFNRNEMLANLLNQLDESAEGFDVYIFIHDDGSNIPFEFDIKNLKNIKNISINRTENNGKKRYWVTVNSIFDRMALNKSDYYYYLSDDIKVEKNFLKQTTTAWKSLRDEKKISLNLLNDGREECWTKFKRVEVCFHGIDFYRTQWLDMLMMFDEKLLQNRVEEIPLSRWEKNPNISSGVGAQLSIRFHNDGYSMFQMKNSLVFHGDHESKMNPEERLLNPLINK